jgi:hypothetical protein
MLSTLYSVTIAGVNNAAPADGFIDYTTIEQYMAQGSIPTTYAQTTAKERANIRFKFLQQQIQNEANVYLTNFVAAGGSSTAAPSSFTFTAEVERGDSVLFTRDETNNNAEMTGMDALTRWIARALIESRTTISDVYDPTKETTPGNSTPAARFGVRETSITVGKLYSNLTTATAAITVTKL